MSESPKAMAPRGSCSLIGSWASLTALRRSRKERRPDPELSKRRNLEAKALCAVSIANQSRKLMEIKGIGVSCSEKLSRSATNHQGSTNGNKFEAT